MIVVGSILFCLGICVVLVAAPDQSSGIGEGRGVFIMAGICTSFLGIILWRIKPGKKTPSSQPSKELGKKFIDMAYDTNLRLCVGQEQVSGTFYLSIPVSTGLCEYDKRYEISNEDYRTFFTDLILAVPFAEQCRNGQNEHLLI